MCQEASVCLQSPAFMGPATWRRPVDPVGSEQVVVTDAVGSSRSGQHQPKLCCGVMVVRQPSALTCVFTIKSCRVLHATFGRRGCVDGQTNAPGRRGHLQKLVVLQACQEAGIPAQHITAKHTQHQARPQAIPYSTAQHSTAQQSTLSIRPGRRRSRTAQHSTSQRSKAHSASGQDAGNPVQHSTAHHSAAKHTQHKAGRLLMYGPAQHSVLSIMP
jgi:hypothetical protein